VLDAEWQSAKETAKATRTIVAQRSLKPKEALREWHRNRESLGSADAVERVGRQRKLVWRCRACRAPHRPR
jgi:hypothetical protein